MSEKLLPCPFCGSTKLESGGDDKFVGVRCLACEATGPNHYRTGSDWGIRTGAPQGMQPDAVRALFEPAESNATDNLEGALIDIKRFKEAGKPPDDVCIRTIERVIAQLAKAEAALVAPSVRSAASSDEPTALRFEIARLELRPGDILVVKVDQVLRSEQIDRIKKMVGDAADLNRCLVLQKVCDLAVLTAAEIEQASTISRKQCGSPSDV